MKRKNLTRNALVTSIISMLLCVSMLVGTTFAWFTDEVTSGRNTIAAGNLDVELLANGTPVNDSTVLFDDVVPNLWEPGAVAYENLQVKNVGTLALKYNLQLTVLEESVVNGYKLSDVIMVGVVNGAITGSDRNAVISSVSTWTKLSEFSLDKANTLAAGAADAEFGIVLYWRPNTNEIDNHYNMNNGRTDVLKLDIGVSLFATQVEAENDSFGNDYDEGLILPDVDGEILVEKDGIQYYYDEGGSYVLYLVTEDYTGDTVNVPEGVDRIGNYAFAYNNNVKTVYLPSTVRDLGRGFDSSAVEKVVLNNGLETISSRAFRSTTALQEVVIPSTVKEIADNAFQKSGIKNITIPASVETVGEAAFGSSKIESVTFEGNTAIQGYAFRGCPNLRTVTLKGNDVTFIPSTLNGRNSMWFCNGESNNPNTSNISFYVVNDTVADRVKTAMGAEANNTPIYINGNLLSNVTDVDGLTAALQAGAKEIHVAAGTYTLPSSDLTAGTTLNCAPGTVFEGAKLNINGATIVGATFSGTPSSNTVNGTYKNCTFTGSNALHYGYAGETVVFENCVFSGDLFGVHFDGGAHEVIFRNCTFSGFNAFGAEITKLTLENCTFKANGKSDYNGINLWGDTELTNCTFVFDGTAGTEWVDLANSNQTVTFTNCTVTDGTNTTPIKDVVGNYGDNNTIIIDGVTANIANMS